MFSVKTFPGYSIIYFSVARCLCGKSKSLI